MAVSLKGANGSLRQSREDKVASRSPTRYPCVRCVLAAAATATAHQIVQAPLSGSPKHPPSPPPQQQAGREGQAEPAKRTHRPNHTCPVRDLGSPGSRGDVPGATKKCAVGPGRAVPTPSRPASPAPGPWGSVLKVTGLDRHRLKAAARMAGGARLTPGPPRAAAGEWTVLSRELPFLRPPGPPASQLRCLQSWQRGGGFCAPSTHTPAAGSLAL